MVLRRLLGLGAKIGGGRGLRKVAREDGLEDRIKDDLGSAAGRGLEDTSTERKYIGI